MSGTDFRGAAILVAAVFVGITSALGAVGSLIAAYRSSAAAETGENNAVKLEEVHQLTNSNLSSVNSQLERALARIDTLEGLLRPKNPETNPVDNGQDRPKQ